MAVETARILRALRPATAEALLKRLDVALDDRDPTDLRTSERVSRWMTALATADIGVIEQHLSDIDGLGDWLGEHCLLETVRDEAPDVLDEFLALEGGAHERAAFIMDARPALFESARRRRYFSHYRLRQKACSRFSVPARADWRPREDDLAQLRAAWAQLLKERAPAGETIIVDPIVRHVAGGVCVQLSIYAAGAAQQIEEIEGDGLVSRLIRPATACVIGYWPESGVLEVVVRNATPLLRAEAAKTFAIVALGADAEAVDDMEAPTITLDRLLERPLLDFVAEDEITSARLVALEVRSMAKLGASVSWAWKGKEGEVWSVIDAFAKKEALLAGVVDHARIRVEYRRPDGRRSSVTFKLSPPHGYQPRGDTPMQRLLIEKYLPRWGLMTRAGVQPWT